MELAKIDLSAIAAIGHDDDHLGLLINSENGLEYTELEAPREAYEGLQELAELFPPNQTQDNQSIYIYEQTLEIKLTQTLTIVNPTQSEDAQLTGINYDATAQSLTLEFNDGSIYEYDQVDPELYAQFQAKIS